MSRGGWRHVMVGCVLVVCVAATLYLFSWPDVTVSLRRTNVWVLVGGSGGLLLLALWVRGLRWLLVLGIPLSPAILLRSMLANGAASGLATVTPFQMGEALKVRLAPGRAGSGWRHGMSGFMVERVLDLACLIGIGLSGMATLAGHTWLAPLLWASPPFVAFGLWLASAYTTRLPKRMQPYLEVFRHRRQVVAAGIATIPLWLLTAGMWWFAAAAIGVRIDFTQLCILLGGVMLATVASMTPSGLGVSELSARGIMIWLGFPVAEAEATAIGLRLLSPLLVLAGLVCLLLVSILRRPAPASST